MLFNSLTYIMVLLPLSLAGYFLLNHLRLTLLAHGWLIACSLFFYGWWKAEYVPLIICSVLANYLIARAMSRYPERGRAIFIAGIACNLGLLGFFKYANFIITNVNYVVGADIALLDVTLPLAISFFTFQQIAYLCDSYLRKVDEHSFLNFAMFVTFFPQLIAGPIVHHAEMLPQMLSRRNSVLNFDNVTRGCFIFTMGLFKKVVIADTLSRIAVAGFDGADMLNVTEAWLTSLSYTFQLYFDFSGYTDMAIGSALMFNIMLPINFNSPYKAVNVRDFWRRWHVTLSRFLRNYVYIPLGGNRMSNVLTARNLFLTFLLGGLWHGAGWTFLCWGALHGVAMVLLLYMPVIRMPRALSWFITFQFINVTWVFFRSMTFGDAMKVLSGMAGLTGTGPVHWDVIGLARGQSALHAGAAGPDITPLYILALAMAVSFLGRNSVEQLSGFRFSVREALITGGMIAAVIHFSAQPSDFLYFNF